jgi:hypothetical protein
MGWDSRFVVSHGKKKESGILISNAHSPFYLSQQLLSMYLVFVPKLPFSMQRVILPWDS